MADNISIIGSWVKRCYFAARTAMDDALRPHDLGSTQWYVLHQLANHGPTQQRELLTMLQVERATLSSVVVTLVRKGLIEQLPDDLDQRKKLLKMTAAGAKLWSELPDLSPIRDIAFDSIDDADLAIAIRVLQTATERLDRASQERK